MSGFMIVQAPVIRAILSPPSGTTAPSATRRRTLLVGWFAGLFCLLLFPNVTTIPEQIYRHLDPADSILTPSDPSVQALVDKFYTTKLNRTAWEALPTFNDRTFAVDEFIFEQVEWKSDFSLYLMLGLLVTPAEALSHGNGTYAGAGDCQAQAAVTCSMLLNMGVKCALIETPFHWTTMARDPNSSAEAFLNQHGNAGRLGTVTPQPTSQTITKQWPPRCAECRDSLAFNEEDTYFVRDPLGAFMNAWTAVHDARRDWTPALVGLGFRALALLGAVIGVVLALYASVFHGDLLSPTIVIRFALRLVVGTVAGCAIIFGIIFWAMVYYCLVQGSVNTRVTTMEQLQSAAKNIW
jgi:hypothetical protein